MHSHFENRFFGAGCRRGVAVGLVLLLCIVGCKRGEEPASQKPPAAPVAITICHGNISDILPRIALEQGYFSEEGLTVTLKHLDGKQSFDGMLQGECNFAVSAASPIVLADPQRTPFSILATVMSDDNSTRIIARRDRGIAKPQDLKGKRIGVKKGVLGHLFFDLFLMKHGLGQNEVVQVFMEQDAFPAALASGEIDGFSMTTSKIFRDATTSLGDKGVVFAEPGLCPVYGILTTRPNIPLNLQSAPGVLRALVRAEQYAKGDPAGAKGVVAKAAKISAQETEEIWDRATIEVALANTLFIHLEDQYRWQMERGGASASVSMPNYLTLVSPEYLRAIKPASVSVIKQE